MKTAVATRERVESRAMPQMPCPDVHPFASRVPKPTRSPAAITVNKLVGRVGAEIE